MHSLRKILNAVIFPPAVIVFILSPISLSLLIYSFVFCDSTDVVSFVAYFLCAYTLAVICSRAPRIIAFFRDFKENNRYARRWKEDPNFRINVSLYSALALNTAYAVLQLGLGVYYASLWFYSLAVYYILLALIRFFLLKYTRNCIPGEDRLSELRRYRAAGVGLLLMNVALTVIIFYITWQNRTFEHGEIVTIAMAAYTFTSFTLAIINLVKFRKHNSPVFSAVKCIGLAAATVSVLTLETTMLTSFGEEGQEQFRLIMTALTGAAVSVFILAMATVMIVQSTRELKALKKSLYENKS